MEPNTKAESYDSKYESLSLRLVEILLAVVFLLPLIIMVIYGR